jgi:hypothetical protein
MSLTWGESDAAEVASPDQFTCVAQSADSLAQLELRVRPAPRNVDAGAEIQDGSDVMSKIWLITGGSRGLACELAKAVLAAATSAFGRLDVVVNNAGYGNIASIEDMADEDFRAQFETNVFGVVNVTKAALPVLPAQRDGHIIQISSIGGRRASVDCQLPNQPHSPSRGSQKLSVERGSTARHSRDERRARRHADRLGRRLDAH